MNFTRPNRSAALGVLLLTACYTQTPLETPAPAPASRIIANLSDSGTVVMANAIGPGADEVEGIVASADASAWTLNLVRVEHRGGTSVAWNREQVTFPRYALSKTTVKSLDKSKSWMAGALIAAGALLASRLFTHGGADEPGGGPPPPPANRIPGGGF